MRESIRFLRIYFIFCGLLGGFITFTHLPQAQQNMIGFIFGVVGIGLSVAWVYVGISFRRLLKTSPKTIMTLLLVQMVLLLLSFLVSLANGLQTDGSVYLVIGLLVNYYLLYNVRCLSAEERSKTNNQ